MANVLLVEDTWFMRMTLRRFLENTGHTVVGEAGTGCEAIHMYRDLQPDLVVLDLTLPDRSGAQTIADLLAVKQEARIIVSSTMEQFQQAIEAMELGAKDFVVKPFVEDQVLETVRNVLREPVLV